MSSLIGILSTVILVSTVCTLIFAVGAYIVARRARTDVNTDEVGTVDIEEAPDHVAPSAPMAREAPIFRRVQGRGTVERVEPPEAADDDYRWK